MSKVMIEGYGPPGSVQQHSLVPSSETQLAYTGSEPLIVGGIGVIVIIVALILRRLVRDSRKPRNYFGD